MVIKEKLPFLITFFLFISFLCTPSIAERAPSKEKIELSKRAVFKKVLENGLTILVSPTSSQDLASIDIRIKAGSSLEGEYSGSGLSHFVEHMVFKGTKTRRPGQIEEEIKSYGGFINGSTSHDLTNFRVTVPSRNLAHAIAILKDMLLNANFDSEELKREKEVVLKEIILNNDEPQSRITRLLYQTAYLNHPYKYPTIGYEERFKALTRVDLLKYYEKMYVPNRIVIAVVGGVDADGAMRTIENEFKDFRAPNYELKPSPVEPIQISNRSQEKEMQISLAYLAMGYHSTGILDKDLFAMDVLSMILGLGDNSRLNKSLFKEKGLVHSVSSWNYTPKDPGLFVISSILDKDNLDALELAILDEIEKIKSGGIEDEELERAKRMALSDYIFSRETIEDQASDISVNEILAGDFDFSRRYVDGVQAVSKEDIRRVANIYLREDNVTIVRLVPSGYSAQSKKTDSVQIQEGRIKKEVLSNGLRILLKRSNKTPTVSIKVAFQGGLLVEDEVRNGISNLTSRMFLKGTTTRKEDKIRGAVENLGGSINAFSGFNSFGLSLDVLKGDLDFTLDLLKDIVTDSTFPQEELDKEKALLIAMMKDEDDDISQRGHNALRKTLFDKHPYGLRVIGERGSVLSLKRQDLLDFYRTYCVPNNIVISISGDIEYETVIEQLKILFQDMKPKEVPVASPIAERPKSVKSQTLEMEREESLLILGFQTVSVKSADRYAFDVLCSVMSGYSGRLFTRLRDRLPIAYALGCSQRLAIDTGYLIFYVLTTRDEIPRAKKELENLIKDISLKGVSDEELLLAKRELISNHKIKAQTNDFFSFQSALDELYTLGYDNLYKYEGQIESVTKEDVKRVATSYFDLNACAEITILSKQ